MAAWRFMHSGSACMMIGFRSDHACIMHKSETDWMHARGQPASARAWPAASGQLAVFHFDFWGTQSRHDKPSIAAHRYLTAYSLLPTRLLFQLVAECRIADALK